MDSFTESILSRARERERLLKGYSNNDKIDEFDTNKPDNKQTHTPPAREKSLLLNKDENNSPRNSPKKIIRQNSNSSYSLEGSPTNSKTLNIQKDNISMEITVHSKDNIRLQVEIEDEDDDSNEKVDTSDGKRKESKKRLNKLKRLYAGDSSISSPIHRTEEKFLVEEPDQVQPKEEKIGKGLKNLANLAKEINDREREDEIKVKTTKEFQKPQIKQLTTKTPAPKSPCRPRPSMIGVSPIKDRINRLKNITSTKEETTPKPIQKIEQKEKTDKSLKWDKSVLDSLESQGFQRKTKELIYDYSKDKKSKESKENINNRTPIKNNIRKEIVPARAATPDPSLLSLSERKALFEKNRGEALVPKAPFAMAIPITTPKIDKNVPSSPIKKTPSSPIKKAPSVVKKTPSSPIKTIPSSPIKKTPTNKNTSSPIKNLVPQANGIANTVASLLKNKQTISQTQIQNEVKEQRKKEMDLLMNRFNKNKDVCTNQTDVVEEDEEEVVSEDESEIDYDEDEDKFLEEQQSPLIKRQSGSKRHSVSPKVAAVLDDIKRIKVSPPKPGRMYPNLSDIDNVTETDEDGTQPSTATTSNNTSVESECEDDEDITNTSFGRDIMAAVNNKSALKRSICDESENSDISDVLDDMDDYLDEALNSEDNKSFEPTPPKQSKSQDKSQASHSFNYKNYSPNVSKNFKSPKVIDIPTKKQTEVTKRVIDGEDVLPLTHTVSFYRKQTNNTPSASPIKKIQRNDEKDTIVEDNRTVILNKIKNLQDEVNKQQLMIAQTSQALNLCNSTLEFMGSTEQVEAERVLLQSIHRRQSILNEIQRLKVEGTLRPQNKHAEDVPLQSGRLTISNIKFPLKKEYVRALTAAGGKGHHVICLVKCGEEVLCSKVVSTVASCSELLIPDELTLKNIYSDFAITLEVYCLQAQEEIIPHELKYHIKKGKATPKKSKNDILSRPNKESPAGPQAVRTPSFALMGYVVFSIHQINKKIWSLNNTPTMSPLDGSIEMKIKCELKSNDEYRGFLTMFEDISGFGAWHRRWCLLKGNSISYWKYPDDEKKKPSIDTIDLSHCITKEVGPVSREICARLNTFLIECVRDPLPEDKDSLVLICKGDKTIIRYLLSADSKEERIGWCSKLNSALTASRLWGHC